MSLNLLRDSWKDIDSRELRLLLSEYYEGPGQYLDPSERPNELHLPRADSSARVVITFRKGRINTIERGEAFDSDEWDLVEKGIGQSIVAACRNSQKGTPLQPAALDSSGSCRPSTPALAGTRHRRRQQGHRKGHCEERSDVATSQRRVAIHNHAEVGKRRGCSPKPIRSHSAVFT